MNINKHKKIHFIGIGGIGVSGLARILLELGKEISGSDLVGSAITDELKKLGATIIIGKHQTRNVPVDCDTVIYTNAAKKSNPEYKKAIKLKKYLASYPEYVGHVLKNYIPIVVVGTHGKSTTTSMLAKIFLEAQLDPTILVGTKISECDGSNARLGLGRHFIVEGDEYKAAFLNYTPVGLIINNIEADHLDFYKNLTGVIKAFTKLITSVPKGGFVIANADDQNIEKILSKAKCRVITFGLEKGDYRALHVVQHGEITRFAVQGLERFDLAIRVPGLHNVRNALAACIMALSFGIKHETIQKALLNYTGAWRRFEVKGEKDGLVVVDDYAHHPTEIKATLAAARKFFPNKKIWCIFQPHSGDRTKQLFNDFVTSFRDCDCLIMTEIYRVAGRERDTKISSKKLSEVIKKTHANTQFIANYKKVPALIKDKLGHADVVITMGAGTITEISNQFLI
jgi:UDP-N-acetylmuramate--alanine ligase